MTEIDWKHPDSAPIGKPILLYVTKVGEQPFGHAMPGIGPVMYGHRAVGNYFRAVQMDGEFCVVTGAIEVAAWAELPAPPAPADIPEAKPIDAELQRRVDEFLKPQTIDGALARQGARR